MVSHNNETVPKRDRSDRISIIQHTLSSKDGTSTVRNGSTTGGFIKSPGRFTQIIDGDSERCSKGETRRASRIKPLDNGRLNSQMFRRAHKLRYDIADAQSQMMSRTFPGPLTEELGQWPLYRDPAVLIASPHNRGLRSILLLSTAVWDRLPR